MDYNKMLYNIEVHSVEGIIQYFHEGGDPNEVHDGMPLLRTIVEMYTRTPRFKDCIKAYIKYGLKFDNAILAVLSNDDQELKKLIIVDKNIVNKIYSLFNCTYTPLTDVTLLHICADYNSPACAKVLLQNGADVNAKAGIDEHGFGGHTPIFHTVNQNSNNSVDMLHLLLEYEANLEITAKGLIWGKGYEWETFIPAVNPISYAMMGLLPQMHRKQDTVAKNVSLLINHAYGIEYDPANVPNAYLETEHFNFLNKIRN